MDPALPRDSWDTATRLPVDEAWDTLCIEGLRCRPSDFTEGLDFGDVLRDLSEELDPNILFHSGF